MSTAIQQPDDHADDPTAAWTAAEQAAMQSGDPAIVEAWCHRHLGYVDEGRARPDPACEGMLICDGCAEEVSRYDPEPPL